MFQDLALSGSLSRSFASDGLAFDANTGLFRVTNPCFSQIKLVGKGARYEMARKALFRNGILAHRDVDSAAYIEVSEMSDESAYILHLADRDPMNVSGVEGLLYCLRKYSFD